jgi:hypothetical protein
MEVVIVAFALGGVVTVEGLGVDDDSSSDLGNVVTTR